MTSQLLVDFKDSPNWRPSPVTDDSGTLQTHSRPLASAASGSVSLWRAPVGSYSSSGIPRGEIFMVHSGHAVVRVRDIDHVLTSGAVFVLPANEPFSFRVTEEFCKFSVDISSFDAV